jgi:hypothetical protein
MARNDDYDDEDFDYGSLSDEHQREFLYDLIGFTQRELDYETRDMFWNVMYNDDLTIGERLSLYQDLNSHIWNEYGINFEEIWDWEAFREWYDTQ